MKTEKRVLCSLPQCYAVEQVGPWYVFATDDTGACVAVDPAAGRQEQVWEGPGGTVSMVPLPDGASFLACQRFLPGFAARHSQIVRAERRDGGWTVTPWMDLPFVHRFDVVEAGGRRWLLACTLCDTDQETADFAIPGSVLVGALGEGGTPPARMETLVHLHSNHGYVRTVVDGETWILATGDEGVFRLLPPAGEQDHWKAEQLVDVPASDAAVCRWDGGIAMAVITPFHGNELRIYRAGAEGYRREAVIPHRSEFLHAIWGGCLAGQEGFLCGGRTGEMELLWITQGPGGVRTEVLETGLGPSNVRVVTRDGAQEILAACYLGGQGVALRVER